MSVESRLGQGATSVVELARLLGEPAELLAALSQLPPQTPPGSPLEGAVPSAPSLNREQGSGGSVEGRVLERRRRLLTGKVGPRA